MTESSTPAIVVAVWLSRETDRLATPGWWTFGLVAVALLVLLLSHGRAGLIWTGIFVGAALIVLGAAVLVPRHDQYDQLADRLLGHGLLAPVFLGVWLLLLVAMVAVVAGRSHVSRLVVAVALVVATPVAIPAARPGVLAGRGRLAVDGCRGVRTGRRGRVAGFGSGEQVGLVALPLPATDEAWTPVAGEVLSASGRLAMFKSSNVVAIDLDRRTVRVIDAHVLEGCRYTLAGEFDQYLFRSNCGPTVIMAFHDGRSYRLRTSATRSFVVQFLDNTNWTAMFSFSGLVVQTPADQTRDVHASGDTACAKKELSACRPFYQGAETRRGFVVSPSSLCHDRVSLPIGMSFERLTYGVWLSYARATCHVSHWQAIERVTIIAPE